MQSDKHCAARQALVAGPSHRTGGHCCSMARRRQGHRCRSPYFRTNL